MHPWLAGRRPRDVGGPSAVKREAEEEWRKTVAPTPAGKNRIMIYGPKSDGTYINTPAGESRQLPRPKKISLCEAPHAPFAIDVAMQLRSSSRSKGDTRCASSSF
jgi:hypothetical protein